MIIVVQSQGSTSFLNYHQYKKMDVRYDQNSGRGRIDLVDATNKKTIIVNSNQQDILDAIANSFVQSIEAGAEFFYVSDVIQQVLSQQEAARQEQEKAKAEPEEPEERQVKVIEPDDVDLYGNEVQPNQDLKEQLKELPDQDQENEEKPKGGE